MNREIKFRAWVPSKKAMQPAGTLDMWFNACADFGINPYKSNPDTIFMQYTELKDINGKEMYEGDILKVDLETEFGLVEHFGVMIFDVNKMQFGIVAPTDLTSLPEYITEKKPPTIIGNIYENPELLKHDLE